MRSDGTELKLTQRGLRAGDCLVTRGAATVIPERQPVPYCGGTKPLVRVMPNFPSPPVSPNDPGTQAEQACTFVWAVLHPTGGSFIDNQRQVRRTRRERMQQTPEYQTTCHNKCCCVWNEVCLVSNRVVKCMLRCANSNMQSMAKKSICRKIMCRIHLKIVSCTIS